MVNAMEKDALVGEGGGEGGGGGGEPWVKVMELAETKNKKGPKIDPGFGLCREAAALTICF